MQRWKLINDAGLMEGPDDSVGNMIIVDGGFASYAHPKLKFNFTIDMTFRQAMVIGDYNESHEVIGNGLMEMFDLPAKIATRPNPSISYVDVNYYNYRTKVATKTEYGTMSITLYDDGDNRAHSVYKNYLNAVSPISNSGLNSTLWDNLDNIPFGQLSSIGPLPDTDPHGIIRTIRVYHHYIVKGEPRRTSYTYINPKIQTFEADDVNMSESDVNTLTLTFNYDGVIIDQDI